MSTRLVVNEQNELREAEYSPGFRYPDAVRFPAHFFSFLFHPLFIPVYVVCFLSFIQPYAFSGIRTNSSLLVIARTFLTYTFFPLVTVLLLKAVGFIGSVFLKTQRDRVIPFIACTIFYFWAWHVNRNLADTLPVMISFNLAIFLACCFGLMANIYIKVSMHALAAGVMMAFIMFFVFTETVNLSLYLCIAILITGAVCTSRLIVSDHSPKEIYVGLLLGIAAQLIALWVS